MRGFKIVHLNLNLGLGHFLLKKHPDLVKSWMNLGNMEFAWAYQTLPKADE